MTRTCKATAKFKNRITVNLNTGYKLHLLENKGLIHKRVRREWRRGKPTPRNTSAYVTVVGGLSTVVMFLSTAVVSYVRDDLECAQYTGVVQWEDKPTDHPAA